MIDWWYDNWLIYNNHYISFIKLLVPARSMIHQVGSRWWRISFTWGSSRRVQMTISTVAPIFVECLSLSLQTLESVCLTTKPLRLAHSFEVECVWLAGLEPVVLDSVDKIKLVVRSSSGMESVPFAQAFFTTTDAYAILEIRYWHKYCQKHRRRIQSKSFYSGLG